MYVDLISYQLAEGVSEETLNAAALDILEVWMKKQEGFMGWEIGKTAEGYTDLVFWKNKECAELATANMGDIPKGHPWLSCYEMSSVSSNKIQGIYSYSVE